MLRDAVQSDALERALGRHLSHPSTVSDLERLTGGASRDTWAFTIHDPNGRAERLILRREPAGATALAAQRVREIDLLVAAAAAGVPVPTPRFALDEQDALGSGYVMDHVEGETLGRRIVHDDTFAAARRQLAAQCGTALAHLHSIDPNAVGLANQLPGRDIDPLGQLAEIEAALDFLDLARPVFELALRWLRRHVPDPVPQRLVHGDFRVGNLIVGPEGLRAVLDWELAHLGHPVEDLGWLCVRAWRFGGAGHVGGCGDTADLLRAYHDTGGQRVDEEDLRYWEIYGTLRWGMICGVQASQHLSGARRSVELAVIGRRICEVEYDLMNLLPSPEVTS